MRLRRILLAIALIGSPAVVAQEQFDIVGSLLLPTAAPESIVLASDITVATPLDLKRALQRRPGAKVIELASDGGSVYGALLMAEEIHERGLNTHVPEGFGCYSACAYVYFAGASRELEGMLGVHQISAADMDIGAEATQFTVADIIETISTFGVASGVITAMLRTPPDEMYVFSAAEVAALALERVAPTTDTRTTPSPPKPTGLVLKANFDPSALTILPKTTADSDAGLRRSERFVTLQAAASLLDVLGRNGFSANQSALVLDALLDVLRIPTLPTKTRLRILYGPIDREATSLVPYRLSLYEPLDDGTYSYQATVALNDSGQYVLGAEPPPIQVGEVTWGTPEHRPTDTSQAPEHQPTGPTQGKSHRFCVNVCGN